MKINLNGTNIDFSSEIKWLEDEWKCIEELQNINSTLLENYPKFAKIGRQHILYKLAAALLREDIKDLYTKSIELRKIGSVYVTSLLNIEGKWEPFFHQLKKLNLSEELTYRILLLNKYIILFPIKNEYAFNRFVFEGDILMITHEAIHKVETAGELLKLIGLKEYMDTLGKELNNGTANLTMAYARHDHWSNSLKEEGNALNVTTTLQYTKAKKGQNPNWSSLLFYEQLALEGHHLHPGTKTKTGMSAVDVSRYSPEFHENFPICFAAVHKDYLLSTESTPNSIEALFPEQFHKFKEIMIKNELEPSSYHLLPVHEWQYNNTLQLFYKQEIEKKIVVPLPSIKANGTATSSFRTLLPLENKNCFIKLAVNSQMTSTVRSISTNTAMNTTIFSNMIKEILKKEQNLKSFVPLYETAGFTFKSSNKNQARNLTVILRENKEMQLPSDEIAIVGSSLYNRSPFTNKTILEELLEEYNFNNELNKEKGAINFFKEYLSITLPGFLTLLTKYGIALEGHLQNSIPVFKMGKPIKFYFRDWGGARIYLKRLISQGISPVFYPESMIVTNSLDELHSKAHYTFIQSHIGEVIRLLVEVSGIYEGEFWKEVKKTCEVVFETLSQDVEHTVKEDLSFFFQKKVKHKALTSMRISEADSYLYTTVNNPIVKKDE